MKRFDVVVIGGGPAGATAARHCSMNGLETLLLEKKKIPRKKSCAGGLTAAAVRELGFELERGLIERECSGVRVQVKDFRKDLTAGRTVFYMVDRARFDGFLVSRASKAGTEIHDGEEALRIERDPAGVVVQTDKGSYLAGVVVGADGFFSTVRKTLERRFDPDEVMFGVLCEVKLDEEEIYRRYGGLLLVHYGYIEGGYAWIFPKRGHVTAGIGGAFSHSGDLQSRLREFLNLHGLDEGAGIRGGHIPVTKFRHPVYDERVILAGDAAGFVDSFTGEGIRCAIISGKIAAETAADCHARGDFSSGAFSVYQKRCEESFGGNLRYASRISDLFSRFSDFVMDSLVDNSEITDAYLKIMTGEMDYRSFSGWIKKQLPGLLIKRVFS